MNASSTATVPDQRDAAVAWMNRGHALLVEGTDHALLGALRAYETAIELLRPRFHESVDANPARFNSLGAALMNRGQLLHRLHGTARSAETLATFDEAESHLRPLVAHSKTPWPRRNLAGTLLNRANLNLDLRQWERAKSDALAALSFCVTWEHENAIDADLSLKARRAVCDACGQLIVQPHAHQHAIADQAIEWVDGALAIALRWASGRLGSWREVIYRLSRFGVQLYRIHRPHDLPRYLRGVVALNDPALVTLVSETIEQVLKAPPPDIPFLQLDDPASERHLQTGRELKKIRSELLA